MPPKRRRATSDIPSIPQKAIKLESQAGIDDETQRLKDEVAQLKRRIASITNLAKTAFNKPTGKQSRRAQRVQE